MKVKIDSFKKLRGELSYRGFIELYNLPITHSAWLKWETGQSLPSAGTIGYLAKKFNKQLQFFFEES